MSKNKNMSIWGIGPIWLILSIIYAIAVYLISQHYSSTFITDFIPSHITNIIGSLLLLIGIPFLVIAGKTILKGFPEGELLTKGVYSKCRNPIYSAWICFIMPGMVLFFNFWLMYTIPIFSYFIFAILVKREEKQLEQLFGEKYIDYKKNVNLLFPSFFKTYKNNS